MTQKISVFFGIAVMAAVLFGGLTFADTAFAGVDESKKTTICHVDQKTGEEKTISVGTPSVPAHLENHEGDHLGECVVESETCQQCRDDWEYLISQSGGDLDLQIAAWIEFGECAATCTGPLDAHEDICINQAAPSLTECLELGQDLTEFNGCKAAYGSALNQCSSG